jgi:hypothetical protein
VIGDHFREQSDHPSDRFWRSLERSPCFPEIAKRSLQ